MEQQRTSPPGCVFVIGMHRSGTSATAAVLDELGLESPSADELVPPTRTNQRGHFEAKTLVRLNDRLLTTVGGTWSAPPPLVPGWERADSLDELRAEASASFDAVFPHRPAAWKDPRNCIVLPFWQSVLGPGTAAVLVYRDPIEVARSLQARNQFSLTEGLALWERYVRSACANLNGLPTLCCDFQSLLDHPRKWCEEAVAFLALVGIAVDTAPLDQAADSVDGSLRHQHKATEGAHGLGSSQRRILEILRSMDGPHHAWPSPDLGLEPDWVGDVLAMRLDLDMLGRAHRSLTTSRAYRLATAVGRLRGRES